jgi:phosphinothricin tripeptide acetyl hydrolase
MDRGIGAVRAHLAKLPPSDSLTIAERRAQYERAERVFPVPTDVKVEHVIAPPVLAEWLAAPGARDDTAVLYLHGGGYVIGSPRSHRHLAAAIGDSAKSRVLLPDYRLAPEHPFPAAVDDAVAAYRWLLDRRIAPARIVIAGDSAGGGLTVATLLALRDAGMPLPGAGVCISPWVDLTCGGASYATRAEVDPIVKRAGIDAMANAYLGGADAKTPLASPLFADLRGLPPLLIHVGDDEVLLDDSVQLAERARKAGVDATLDVWPKMVHVWHWFFPMLDEGHAAIDRIGTFVQARTSLTQPFRSEAPRSR